LKNGLDHVDYWLLIPVDEALIAAKSRANRLGFAVLLMFFRDRGRFPRIESEIDKNWVKELASQFNLEGALDHAAIINGRTAERYRAEIRLRFGFREALERYRRQVEVEAPFELRRHPNPIRMTLLAAFVHLRGRSLTDGLVDLLIETIHHIGARAERKVERELLDDLKRVTGKHNLLFELADAALGKPDGIVRDVVFPVVQEETLRNLVKEWKATGPTYRTTLRTVIRNSYKGHYRRMVPKLLEILDFRSNNDHHRPVIQALDLIKRYSETQLQTFPAKEDVPLDGVVRGLWREAVVEKDAEGHTRVNRITYEVAVLEALRSKLRCKEIWVVGANRYRNPDEDLPADFEENYSTYYQALNLPVEADSFITELQTEMRQALTKLQAYWPSYEKILKILRNLESVCF
jgi:hypothetical protein